MPTVFKTKKGSLLVTIPKPLAKAVGIDCGDKFDIKYNSEQELILKKIIRR